MRTGCADWLVLNAPAKINLSLEVLGRRADGYHELVTEMACISLTDRLAFRPSEGLITGSVRASSGYRGTLPDWDRNLVCRALELLRNAAGVKSGMEVRIEKRIPLQGGLGGGSSDAAAALIAGNCLWEAGWSRDRLMELGASLGSDVPFFLSGGRAICRGRGEQIEELPVRAGLTVVVAEPPEGLSTPAVFESLGMEKGHWAGRPDKPGAGSRGEILPPVADVVTATRAGSSVSARETRVTNSQGLAREASRNNGPRSRMFNRLESAAARLSPWPALCREVFEAAGCRECLMSGSGTCFYGLFPGHRTAVRAIRVMASRLPSVRFHLCRTVPALRIAWNGTCRC